MCLFRKMVFGVSLLVLALFIPEATTSVGYVRTLAEPPTGSLPIFLWEKQLESFPKKVRESPGNEAILVDDQGVCTIFFINRPGDADRVMYRQYTGESWSEPKMAFSLSGKAYHALQVQPVKNGGLVCVFHQFGEGNGGYRGRHLDLWVSRRVGGIWSAPVKILEGYVGALRGFKKLESGRLLLAFGKAVPDREEPPADEAPDYGWNVVRIMYSDDEGKSWHSSGKELEVKIDNRKVTRYGAIEPDLIEKKDGSLWMLIRTSHGRLYQAMSLDKGESWTNPVASQFISSDSPACLYRLKNGSILLFWNSCQRWDTVRSYALGGREVLHAAVSWDEGASWQGFREVAHSVQSPSTVGDRGTAYPSVVETESGDILLATGQGEGKGIYALHPRWISETALDIIFTRSGGVKTINGISTHGADNRVTGVHIPEIDSCGEYVVNFPMAKKGSLKLSIPISQNGKTLSLALTDHFSIPSDQQASQNAVYLVEIEAEVIGKLPGNDAAALIQLDWNLSNAEEVLEVSVNGTPIGRYPPERKTVLGLNYIRLGTSSSPHMPILLESLQFISNE